MLQTNKFFLNTDSHSRCIRAAQFVVLCSIFIQGKLANGFAYPSVSTLPHPNGPSCKQRCGGRSSGLFGIAPSFPQRQQYDDLLRLHMSQELHHSPSGVSRHSNSTLLSATAVSTSEGCYVRKSVLGNLPRHAPARKLVKNDYVLQLDYSHDRHHTHHAHPSSSVVSDHATQGYAADAAVKWGVSDVLEVDSTGVPLSSIQESLSSASYGAVVPPAVTSLEKERLQQEAQERSIMVARLLLIAAAALYGTNFSLVKLMGQDTSLPVGVTSTLRFGLAALATSPWLFAPSKSSPEETYDDDALLSTAGATDLTLLPDSWGSFLGGFEVGLWASIGYIAQAVGLESTPAGESAFLCSLAVVVVPFLDLLSGRRLKGREWVGAAMALAGVGLLELGTSFNEITWTYGDWASMLQPLFFGMGFWRMEHVMHKYPNEASRCTAAQLLAVAFGSAIYSVLAEGTGVWDWNQLQVWLSDPSLLAMIAWTGVASTALSVYMETRALQTLSASETTLLLSTEPLWGAGFAALLIGEQFGVDSAIVDEAIMVAFASDVSEASIKLLNTRCSGPDAWCTGIIAKTVGTSD
ncbi:hypothetical protein ACA910_000345 [Epithemia clementina (nom. ined.)]